MKATKEHIPFYPKTSCHRSSTVFYLEKNENTSTSISVLNYWKIKRDINVKAYCMVRRLDGKAFGPKKEIEFSEGYVYNYHGQDLPSSFEGSVEMEFVSDQDLVIPYSAVMAVYKRKNSISLTHSYSRAYSESELNLSSTVTLGEESCWTIRDTLTVRSFGVFHNGPLATEEQDILLTVSNFANKTITAKVRLKRLMPYETVKLYPSDYIASLSDFLENQPGSASIVFKVKSAFPRMLLCYESVDKKMLQTLHSNFNYSLKDPGFIDSEDAVAKMNLLKLPQGESSIIIYPDFADGEYSLKWDSGQRLINSDLRHPLLIDCDGSTLSIKPIDNALPKRFVTGFQIQMEGSLAVEVSRGVRHQEEPPKHFWWGPVLTTTQESTYIVVQEYKNSMDFPLKEMTATMRLYCSHSHEFLEESVRLIDLISQCSTCIAEIFLTSRQFLKDDFGYFTLYSDHPSLDVLTLISDSNGFVGLEHCF